MPSWLSVVLSDYWVVEYQWLSVYNPIPSLVKVLEARFSEHPPLVDPLPQSEHHRFQHLLLTSGRSGREIHCTQARERTTQMRGCEHCRKEYNFVSFILMSTRCCPFSIGLVVCIKCWQVDSLNQYRLCTMCTGGFVCSVYIIGKTLLCTCLLEWWMFVLYIVMCCISK